MKIWVNTLVQNEERYVWYAIMSVIDYVDKVVVWDTGSKDNTIKIVKEIAKNYPTKIIFKEVGNVSVEDYPSVRQAMLKETVCDWFIILDGDEVWWNDSIKELVETIRNHGSKLDSIVSHYTNLIGDIYHFQEETAGNYKIDDVKGHITIRAMNRQIPGLNISRPHGKQGFFNGNGELIQEMDKKRRIHLSGKYLHFTHLKRSSYDVDVPKRPMKLKYELGNDFPLDFYYPEVFFQNRPEIVPCVWETMNADFYRKSLFLTLPRKLKRRLIEGPSGY